MSDPVYDYILMAETSTRRALLQRAKSNPGGAFKRIAIFDSYNDAEWVLRQLNDADEEEEE